MISEIHSAISKLCSIIAEYQLVWVALIDFTSHSNAPERQRECNAIKEMMKTCHELVQGVINERNRLKEYLTRSKKPDLPLMDPPQRVWDFIKAHMDDESSLGAYPNVNLVEEQTNDQKLNLEVTQYVQPTFKEELRALRSQILKLQSSFLF